MKAILHKCEWIIEGVFAKTEECEIQIPQKNRLDFLQDLVGGWIDIYNHNGNDLVVNDEGLLLSLPINPWAMSHGLHLVGNIVEVQGILD